MKLLLIGDNATMQARLQPSFERRGIAMVTCSDGNQALDRWRASVPYVVLPDLSLPGRDGLQVLANARAVGLATPVIIVTARGTVGGRILGLNTGADDYLPKPFDLDELEARVRALARRGGGGATGTAPPQQAADTACDRTLLAPAKAIGELLGVAGTADAPRLLASAPYSALAAFEADNRSRLYFKVSGFQGERVSGFEDLPAWRGKIPDRSTYAALVDFYDDQYRGQPVRVAVLLQPVADQVGQGMATIQVAETLELRRTLARQVLIDTLGARPRCWR